jgi:tRNA(adenine34) deaminase
MSIIDNPEEFYMQQALREAKTAYDEGEIPIGAVIECGGNIIAKAHNSTELLHDPTAHAEMLAITSATESLGAKYLSDCTLYVTLEPCVMCAGALGWSQIGRIVYGAGDDKRGFERLGHSMLHPKTKVEHGLLAADCMKLLLDFFKEHRK